jgi:Spy/CpxP family protein refolding chaperone
MKKAILGTLATLAVCGLVALAADEKAPGGGKDKGAQARAGGRFAGGGKLAGLGLTDEQKAKIAEIRQAVRERIAAVLTDEQKAKFQALRQKVGERVKELRPNLTDDQKAKVKEILQAARQTAQAATSPEEKLKAFGAAKEEIRKLLTEEQAQKIEALKGKLGGLRGAVQKWRARSGAEGTGKAAE